MPHEGVEHRATPPRPSSTARAWLRRSPRTPNLRRSIGRLGEEASRVRRWANPTAKSWLRSVAGGTLGINGCFGRINPPRTCATGCITRWDRRTRSSARRRVVWLQWDKVERSGEWLVPGGERFPIERVRPPCRRGHRRLVGLTVCGRR